MRGVVVSRGSHVVGRVVVAAGAGFSNTRSQYDEFWPGPFTDEARLTPFFLTLDEFTARFEQTGPQRGTPRDFRADISKALREVLIVYPGANVQIRVGERAGTELDAFAPAADGTIEGTTRFTFDEPATAGFVLVWITGLVPSDEGFAADIAEIEVQAAG